MQIEKTKQSKPTLYVADHLNGEKKQRKPGYQN